MEIDVSEYDVDAIRRDLEDYYGTAMVNVSPFAMVDLIDLSNKSDYEIIVMAKNIGLNINNYNIGKSK